MSTQDKFPGDKVHVELLATGDIDSLTSVRSHIDKLPVVMRKFDNGIEVENLPVSSEYKGMSLQAHFDMSAVNIAADTTLRVAVDVFHLTGSDDPVTGTFEAVDLNDVFGKCVAPDAVNLTDNKIYLDVVVGDAEADGIIGSAKCEISLLRKLYRHLRFEYASSNLTSAGADAGLDGGNVVVVALLEGAEHPVENGSYRSTPALVALP